ncbi:hypothetical protein B0H14DRAFT_2820655 [Mycena olivaceomarginata]|nr:hypothetical protein B0H14DRAFT_2820655 [Mycena olivaceomarginata]
MRRTSTNPSVPQPRNPYVQSMSPNVGQPMNNPPFPVPTSPPPPPSLPVQPAISIHRDFSPTAKQIMEYMENGCQALIRRGGQTIQGYQSLLALSARWREKRISRVRSQTNPGHIDYVELYGRSGIQMKICDFYSALGYIISQADPFTYTGRETIEEKRSIHVKMLATYANWIIIVSSRFTDQPAPSTACVIYEPDNNPVPAAVFPNLSGDDQMKKKGRGNQQLNLHEFILQLGIDINFATASPREKNGGKVQFGDCAEINCLIFMFDPKTAAHYFLNGMAADVTKMPTRTNPNWVYNEGHFCSQVLKRACANCEYIVRVVNSAMVNAAIATAVAPAGGFTLANTPGGFRYRDLAPPSQVLPTKSHRTCVSTLCQRPALVQFQCVGCKTAMWCCNDCRENGMPEHQRTCAMLQCCAKCYQRNPQRICRGCAKVPGRIPARYCSESHEKEHRSIHGRWCEDPNNTGVIPQMHSAMGHDLSRGPKYDV